MGRLLKWLLAAGAVLFVLIQFIPYGRDHDNPPVLAEPAWDSPATRELAVRACFDCHSNETNWAWYSNIAPISWVIQRDVDEGREKLNWSEWGPGSEGDESAETVVEGSMPPRKYTLIHPDARLTDQEIASLAAGFEATFGSSEHGGESGEDDD